MLEGAEPETVAGAESSQPEESEDLSFRGGADYRDRVRHLSKNTQAARSTHHLDA